MPYLRRTRRLRSPWWAGAEASTLDCTGADLCEGFEDRTEPVAGAWNDALLEGGELAITANARTGARGLRASAGAQAAPEAALRVRFDAVKTIRVRTAVRAPIPSRNEMHLSALQFSSANATAAIFLLTEGTKGAFVEQLFENGKQTAYNASPVFDLPDRWFDVEVSLDLTARTLDASVDGVLVVEKYRTAVYPSNKPTLLAGITYSSAGPAYAVDLDDIRVYLTR